MELDPTRRIVVPYSHLDYFSTEFYTSVIFFTFGGAGGKNFTFPEAGGKTF